MIDTELPMAPSAGALPRGFAGPWGVEIISDAHRQRPLQEALVDAHRTTMALFA